MIRFAPAPAAIIAAQPRRCEKSLLEKLSDAIREMGFSGEPITVDGLMQRGFTRSVILPNLDNAVALARRRSIRQTA